MSILFESTLGWIISHQNFFGHLQTSSTDIISSSGVLKLKLNPDLFQINKPFVQEKKIRNIAKTGEDENEVEKQFSELINSGSSQAFKVNFMSGSIEKGQEQSSADDNNTTARKTARNFYNELSHLDFIGDELRFNGANTTDAAVISQVAGHSFLFPYNTQFYCGDVKEVIFKHFSDKENLFDLIIMDPPWKNKCIWRNNKRKRTEGGGYRLVDNDEIGSIPVNKIARDRALIIVWCTNATAHRDDIINYMFPKWNVTYLTTWYWVKVTHSGTPICPFNISSKKQPYETIVIGRHFLPHNKRKEISSSTSHEDITSRKIIISQPSALHSHKPPLIDILLKFLPSQPKCCELFARYLVPGFISIGNEVIKLQHVSLYVDKNTNPDT